jgi:hypothetical protein
VIQPRRLRHETRDLPQIGLWKRSNWRTPQSVYSSLMLGLEVFRLLINKHTQFMSRSRWSRGYDPPLGVQVTTSKLGGVLCSSHRWDLSFCFSTGLDILDCCRLTRTALINYITIRPTSQLRLISAKAVTAHTRRLRRLKQVPPIGNWLEISLIDRKFVSWGTGSYS